MRKVTFRHTCHFRKLSVEWIQGLIFASSTKTMVNHAKSNALKTQIDREQKDKLMAHALALFHSQQVGTATGKPMSIRKLCQLVSDEHYAKTQKRIAVDDTTLGRLIKGGITKTESNGKKSWLTKEEGDIIVDYAIEKACQGFPLSPKRLREHAEKILIARLGNKFPETGLGINWGTRFITRHHDRLGMYWSSAMDTSRGRAVNPITKAEYFKIMKESRDDYDIPDYLVYGADETGIQTGIGVTERVIGPAGAKMQHQQRSGNRENITVLPTICADGTSVPPVVIYKGEAFQTKWNQDNPLDARYLIIDFT